MRTDKAPVIVLFNYYKSRTQEELEYGARQTQEMLDGLQALGHRAVAVEFWNDIRPGLAKYDPNEWIVFNWGEAVEDEIAGDARVCEAR
jgi:hypothetical protein